MQKDLIFPERRKLRILPKVPIQDANKKTQRMPKRLIDMRGPELIHNKLIYKMFGIRVSTKYKMIRREQSEINKKTLNLLYFFSNILGIARRKYETWT